MGRARIPGPVRFERFLTRVPEMPCVIYLGAWDRDGYGVFGGHNAAGGKRQYRAHIYAWELAHGAVPDGMFVCHHCDVRCCVNAYGCLFLGTNQDNDDDMRTKSREWKGPRGVMRGEDSPNAKLNEEQVLAIRAARKWGIGPTLATQYGVSVHLIHAIWERKAWAHI